MCFATAEAATSPYLRARWCLCRHMANVNVRVSSQECCRQLPSPRHMKKIFGMNKRLFPSLERAEWYPNGQWAEDLLIDCDRPLRYGVVRAAHISSSCWEVLSSLGWFCLWMNPLRHYFQQGLQPQASPSLLGSLFMTKELPPYTSRSWHYVGNVSNVYNVGLCLPISYIS